MAGEGSVQLQELQAELRELRDRGEIADCLNRYCRGLDRLDRELALSAFHDDATVCNSWLSSTPAEFVDHYWSRASARAVCAHHVTNLTIELDGDTAHTEAYWLLPKAQAGDDLTVLGGRYVSRFERRDGVWRIAVQFNIAEWHLLADGAATARVQAERHAPTAKDPSDISYERPLQPQAPRAGGEWAATIAP